MIRPGLAALSLVAALAACGRDTPRPASPLPATQVAVSDPHALAQQELEKTTLDLQRFVAVRLQDGDRRLEATPMAPAIVADARLGDESFKTLFRVNAQGDTLILFSRDVFNARSYRTEIPLSELARQKSFSFPVVQPDGSLKSRDFKLIAIIRPE